MKEAVKLVGGKFVKTGKAEKVAGEKPPKFRYSAYQYQALLKIAKADGIDIGDTKGKATQAVNIMTGLVLDSFITDRSKS